MDEDKKEAGWTAWGPVRFPYLAHTDPVPIPFHTIRWHRYGTATEPRQDRYDGEEEEQQESASSTGIADPWTEADTYSASPPSSPDRTIYIEDVD